MTMRKDFAHYMQDKIKLILASSKELTMSPTVLRESEKSLRELGYIIDALQNSNEAMNNESMNPLIEFLRNRYARILGTDSFYQLNKGKSTDTPANQICVVLAQKLSDIDNKLHWPARKPMDFLMPAQRQDLTDSARNQPLRRFIFSECQSADEVIGELVQFPMREWLSCLNDIEHEKLQNVFFKSGMPAKVDDMKHVVFSHDALKNKAIICCLFQIYINNRDSKPEKLSFFAYYKKPQKLAAARAVQDYLLADKSVHEFQDALKRSSDLKDHAAALEDGTLKLFKELLSACALAELKPDSDADILACRVK